MNERKNTQENQGNHALSGPRGPGPNQSLFHSLAAKALYFCPLCRMAGLLEIEETAGSVSPGS
jgi:hypothetical protein